MAELKDDKVIRKIALVVKAMRMEKGVTQEQMYMDTNIHIGRLESANQNVSISTLTAICKYFKIKLSDFFKRVEDQK